MALDDFKTDKEFEIGTVRTRKKVINIDLPEDELVRLFYYHPHIAVALSYGLNETDIKAVVQTLDELIKEGDPDSTGDSHASDDHKDDLILAREEIVDHHLRENG